MRARRLGRLALGAQQRGVQHVLHQRRLAGAGHAGDADQAAERDRDVDVLQVVLGGAAHHEPRIAGPRRAHGVRRPAPRPCGPDRYAAVSVSAPAASSAGVPLKTIRPPCSPGPGPDVEDAVGREHDLRVVLDDQQRVAGVAQPLHHLDHAPHVARVQADRRLVEHEQRVDQRGAERGREVDALHLAAGQRARLAVERQVAEADAHQEVEARADLAEQQVGGLVERRRQRQRGEEAADALDRQQHQVVDVEPGWPSPDAPSRHSSASGLSRAPPQAGQAV